MLFSFFSTKKNEKIGIKEVWLTPHIMEDIPNTIEELRDRFQELQEAYQGTVKLNLAAENMMDNLFSERLESKELLPIGSKGDHLLVETSYYQPPIDLYGTLKRVKELGFTPILAHPERYRYMNDTDYDYLYSKGVKLQMNIMSLAGVYGDSAQEKAQMLLSKGYYTTYPESYLLRNNKLSLPILKMRSMMERSGMKPCFC